MAGHSKWANIQHRKGRQDAKRGKIFTKVAKDVIIAAKEGGGDPDANSRLRLAIAKAKAVNMPNDKIDLAIKKGTGELAGGDIQEVVYEGYGPGGVAILVEAATDNRNRTVAEVRHLLSKGGGSMGEAGCVAWMFDKKGVVAVDKAAKSEDELLEISLEAGAEDVVEDGDTMEVRTLPEDFAAVQAAMDEAGIPYERAEITMVPQNLVEVDVETAKKLIRLIDNLEDQDDVQNVHLNADFPDEAFEED